MKTNIHFFITSRSFLLIMRNVSDKSCKKNQNTHFVFSNVLRKLCRLRDNVEKHCTAGEAIDDMHISRWVPKAKKNALRICNCYCFSTSTMVAQKRLSFTLYVHCLSCYSIYTIYKCDRRQHNTIWRAAGWRPKRQRVKPYRPEAHVKLQS